MKMNGLLLILVFAGYFMTPWMFNTWGDASTWLNPFFVWASFILFSGWLIAQQFPEDTP